MKGKLKWFYGCMNSSKSATLLMTAHQLEQCGVKTILMKHEFDKRDFGVIKSRALSEERNCCVFTDESNLYEFLSNMIKFLNLCESDFSVLVDEVSFAKPEHIEQLWKFSKEYGVNVYCFGLKTKASNELFESVPNLFIYADEIAELKTKCMRCSNDATTHLLFVEDVPVVKYDTSLVTGDIDGNIRYECLCQCCRSEIVDKEN